MASNTFSPESAIKSLVEDGYYDLKDSGVGEPISELEKRGFDYFTEYGLNFCKQYVLDDKRIRSILEATFQRCRLGHWLRYKAYKGIECYRRGGPKAGRHVLMVLLLARGTRISCYRGSHLQDLPTEMGRRSLYEIPQSALDGVGCPAHEIECADGGVVILDARLAREIIEGFAITFVFATEDIIARWAPMILPSSEKLLPIVDTLESAKIGVNFAFLSPPSRPNT